jgi:hypothetical protein
VAAQKSAKREKILSLPGLQHVAFNQSGKKFVTIKFYIVMSTKVKTTCVSKKESKNYDAEHPIATAIELEVPYDQNSIYWKLSGGTNLTLNTVNQDAADMFVIGKEYDIVISPSENESA